MAQYNHGLIVSARGKKTLLSCWCSIICAGPDAHPAACRPFIACKSSAEALWPQPGWDMRQVRESSWECFKIFSFTNCKLHLSLICCQGASLSYQYTNILLCIIIQCTKRSYYFTNQYVICNSNPYSLEETTFS